ncbi:MAG: glycosyl hydrolase family protein, partial [Verrucomicrobiaceae bacterium]
LNSTFRTYGLDWKAGSMGWYYENGRVALLNNSSAISAAANNYLIINLAVGGWPGTPNPAHYPTTFECEWVRVWKQVAAPARRLTGHWRLDEKHPGPVNDATGNGDGNLINAPLTGGSGPAGDGAFDFPGTNQAVNTNRSSLVPASGDFTLTVNFKTRGTHTPQGHLLSNNNFQAGRCALFVENGLLKWWHHLGASLSSTNRVDDGAWHRADLVRMGNEWSLWLDGQVVDSGISDAAISQTQAWFIGRANQANFSYNGLISDVKVWNHARGVGSKIHHWPLDENPGTFTGTHALADQSSPSAPATLAAPEDETDLVRFNEPGATPDSGGSILLGGRYERIELGNVSPREEPFTLSFWFKSKAFRRWEADQDHILSSNGGQSGRWNIHLYGDPAYLSQNGGPMLQFFHDGYGAVTLDPVVTPGTWNHVAIVRDENAGENFRIYLNGGLVHTGTNQLDFTDSPMGVLAGRRPSSPMSSGFEGWIDDIRFHHGAVDGRINELAGGGYDKWARSRFGANAGEPGTLASDDPDGAGITNFQRYTFGTDGGSEYGQSARMPGGTPGGAVNLEFRVRPDPTIRYFIQSTTSLDAWNSLGFRYRNPAWVPDDPAAMRLTPIDTVDGTVTLEATLPPAAPATPARFVRIKAMMPATKAP